MPSDKPRKHHFLPQFYLRGFAATDGSISQLFRRELKVVGTNVGDAAVRRDFHHFEVSKPGFDEFEMEKMLAQVEGIQATAVRAVLTDPGTLTQHRVELLGFAQFMFFRVPKLREAVAASTKAALVAKIKVMEKGGGLDDMPADLKAHLAGRSFLEAFSPEIKNWFVMLQLLRLANGHELYRLLYSMNVSFLMADGFTPFVVGDAAAVLFDRNYTGLTGNVGGFASPTAELTIPLSARVMLRISRLAPTGVFRISERDVRHYNQRAIVWSERSLFSEVFPSSTLADVSLLAGKSAGLTVENLDATDAVYTVSKLRPVYPELLLSESH